MGKSKELWEEMEYNNLNCSMRQAQVSYYIDSIDKLISEGYYVVETIHVDKKDNSNNIIQVILVLKNGYKIQCSKEKGYTEETCISSLKNAIRVKLAELESYKNFK